MTRRRTVLFATLLVAASVTPAVALDGLAVASTDSLAVASTDSLAVASTDSLAVASTDGLAVASTDGLAEFSLKPGGTVAAPGGTVRILVFLRSSPQVASGAYEAEFVLQFDPAALRATDVSRGRFMDRGEDTTVRTNVSKVDNGAGVVRYGLVRDPPRGGVAGYARFATVTFEVREDAPDGTYDLTFRRTRVLLTDGGYQQVASYGARVTVASTATEAATPTATTAPGNGGSAGIAAGVATVLAAAALLAGVLALVRRA